MELEQRTIERILQAAEASAAEIQRHAQEDARRVREQAERDGERIRGEARDSAREHLAAMIQVTARLVEQLGALEPAGRREHPERESQPSSTGAGMDRATEASVRAAEHQPEGDDLDGARLIALNMALNGESRADTERYLAENFTLPDRGRLIDEVYAAIEG